MMLVPCSQSPSTNPLVSQAVPVKNWLHERCGQTHGFLRWVKDVVPNIIWYTSQFEWLAPKYQVAPLIGKTEKQLTAGSKSLQIQVFLQLRRDFRNNGPVLGLDYSKYGFKGVQSGSKKQNLKKQTLKNSMRLFSKIPILPEILLYWQLSKKNTCHGGPRGHRLGQCHLQVRPGGCRAHFGALQSGKAEAWHRGDDWGNMAWVEPCGLLVLVLLGWESLFEMLRGCDFFYWIYKSFSVPMCCPDCMNSKKHIFTASVKKDDMN